MSNDELIELFSAGGIGTKAKAEPKSIPDLSSMSTAMVNLDVELLQDGQNVKRSFLVPLNSDFTTLHYILQIGFGWQDLHPHSFTHSKGKVPVDEELRVLFHPKREAEKLRDALHRYGALLADYIPPVKRIDYIYDDTFRWKHVIRVGKTKIVKGWPYATCTGGIGSAPSEKYGESISYQQLEILLCDAKYKEYMRLLDWPSDDPSIPFDQDHINAGLKKLNFMTQIF